MFYVHPHLIGGEHQHSHDEQSFNKNKVIETNSKNICGEKEFEFSLFLTPFCSVQSGNKRLCCPQRSSTVWLLVQI